MTKAQINNVLTEKQALEFAKQNNQRAFSFLLDKYWSDIYKFQRSRVPIEADVEDIVIQTFSKAFDKIHSYNSQFPFKNWLLTISKNIHVDMLRKCKIETASVDEESSTLHEFVDKNESPEDLLIKEQNLAKLQRDIKKLKPAYQKVIQLRFFQEKSYKEIASELEEPINNIKVKLLRAKKILAKIITAK